MNILFISTLNLATNPRLFKEVKLALGEGHSVELVIFDFENWSKKFNRELKIQLDGVKITSINAGRNPFFPWLCSIFFEKLYRWLGLFISLNSSALSQAVSRRSHLIVSALRKIDGTFHLVIGHNPGALYPVVFAAKKFNCDAGFDVEDYHPGEGTNLNVQALTGKLFRRLLPLMDYVSFAAPLIMKKTIDDIGKGNRNWFVILNYFKSTDFSIEGVKDEGPVRLVWFSQNINYKRGLEQMVPELKHFEGKIELTLIGNKKKQFFDEYLLNNKSVKTIAPMDQKSLHAAITGFDIGLAIEPGKDKNNFIALANKLITYFQAGLFILASDTPAHQDFFAQHPSHGVAVSLERQNIPVVFEKLIEDIGMIRKQKAERLMDSRRYCWETESLKLLQAWQEFT